MRVNPICKWFGHTGTNEDNGSHICGRCWSHSYHDFEQYNVEGLLWTPFRWSKWKLKQLCRKIRQEWRAIAEDDADVPF